MRKLGKLELQWWLQTGTALLCMATERQNCARFIFRSQCIHNDYVTWWYMIKNSLAGPQKHKAKSKLCQDGQDYRFLRKQCIFCKLVVDLRSCPPSFNSNSWGQRGSCSLVWNGKIWIFRTFWDISFNDELIELLNHPYLSKIYQHLAEIWPKMEYELMFVWECGHNKCYSGLGHISARYRWIFVQYGSF